MAKVYKGSLSLDWYNKQKSILLQTSQSIKQNDIPAPGISWVNKDESLYYDISDEGGVGLVPYWVDRNDLRVKEARPLKFVSAFKAVTKDKEGTIPGTNTYFEVEEIKNERDSAAIENILIKGDNLQALNTIKKLFEKKPDNEKVKCIFIDPPYNTQYAFQHYDDNLAHSEWLSLMRDRLVILRDILSETGSIWISIDDGESHYLKVLCDEIFGRQNFIAEVIWQKRTSRENRAAIGSSHDTILVYAKKPAVEWKQFRNKLNPTALGYSNPDNDERGPWRSIPFSAQGFRKNQMYKITTTTGVVHDPPKGRCWSAIESEYLRLKAENKVYFPDEGNGKPRIKKFPWEDEGLVPMSLWLAKNVGTTEESKKEILDLFPDIEPFGTPKPEKLINEILTIGTDENDIVLDCFGGSGTTFAVAHKMKRKWIGVEVGSQADTYIVERMKKVISGKDKGGVTDETKWMGGGSFKYFHLGESIIVQGKDGSEDFNWTLGKKFIEESMLLSYDYVINSEIDFQADQLFQNEKNIPTIGVQQIGSRNRVAIVTINEPNGKLSIISYEEISSIYKAVKQKFAPEYINIFTNRGVEMAFDSKPEDLEVIKIPHAIFAELEK